MIVCHVACKSLNIFHDACKGKKITCEIPTNNLVNIGSKSFFVIYSNNFSFIITLNQNCLRLIMHIAVHDLITQYTFIGYAKNCSCKQIVKESNVCVRVFCMQQYSRFYDPYQFIYVVFSFLCTCNIHHLFKLCMSN